MKKQSDYFKLINAKELAWTAQKCQFHERKKMAEKLFQIKEDKNACQTVAIDNLQILDQKIKIYIKDNSENIGMNCIFGNSIISVLKVLNVIIFL